jgi:hypothetical protein
MRWSRETLTSPSTWIGVLTVAVTALLFFLLIGLFNSAKAADATLSWTPPTHNTDNTAIPATGPGSLSQYRAEWGTCVSGAFGVKAGEKTQAAPATGTTITGLDPATYCFRVFARNTYGAESPASNVASKIVPAPVPQAPVLAVPVILGMTTTPVYSVARNGTMSTFVGFADVGSPCAGPVLFKYRGKDFREVSREAVKLWGATTLRLAAPCAAG